MWIAWLFGMILCVWQPTALVPYSDTFGLFMVCVAFWLITWIMKSDHPAVKIVLSFFLGLTLLVGYQVKPTVLIIGIAAGIALILFGYMIRKKSAFVLAACLCSFLAAGFCSNFLLDRFSEKAYYNQPTTEEMERLAYTPLHYLAMGLSENAERKTYGAYNGADDQATSVIFGKENKNANSMKLIQERIQNYGFFGLMKHFWNKMIWVTTDGSFAYGYEGRDLSDQAGILERAGTAWIDQRSGFYQNFLANLDQACWLVLWIFASIGIFIPGDRKNSYVQKAARFILELSLLGIVAFLILFEASPRYIYLYSPVLIALSSCNAVFLFRNRKKKAVLESERYK